MRFILWAAAAVAAVLVGVDGQLVLPNLTELADLEPQSVRSFRDMRLAVTGCTGKCHISVERAIRWEVNSMLTIPAGVSVLVAGPPETARLSRKTATSPPPLFSVEGVLEFENIVATGVQLAAASGENATIEVTECSISNSESTLALEDGASLSVYGSTLNAASGTAISGCATCSVELFNTKIVIVDPTTTALISSARRADISGLELDTVTTDLFVVTPGSSETSVTRLQDAKNYYQPYENCTDSTVLSTISSISSRSCHERCDEKEDCVGAVWNAVFDNITNPITCDLLSTVDIESCDLLDPNVEITATVGMFQVKVDNSEFMPTQAYSALPAGICLKPATTFTVPSAGSVMSCKAWCRYHGASCNAITFVDEVCLASDNIETVDCASTATVYIPVKTEYITVAQNCSSSMESIETYPGGAGACATLCEMMGDACKATLVSGTDCKLIGGIEPLREGFATGKCNLVGSSGILRVSATSPAAVFPKHEVARLVHPQLCFLAPKIRQAQLSADLAVADRVVVCEQKCNELVGCVASQTSNNNKCNFFSSAELKVDGRCKQSTLSMRSSMLNFVSVNSPGPLSKAVFMHNSSIDACKMACWLDDACSTFHYEPRGSLCALEANIGDVYEPLAGAFVARQTVTPFTANQHPVVLQQSSVFTIGTTTQVTAVDADTCHLVCVLSTDCSVWSHTDTTCTLYQNAIINQHSEQGSGDVLNIVTGNELERVYSKPGKQCQPTEPIGDIVDAPKAAACMAVCDISRGCEALTFFNGQCAFFGKAASTCAESSPAAVYESESSSEFTQVPASLCLDGQAIETTPAVSLETCKRTCDASAERCQSFEFNFNTGECSLARGLALKECSGGSVDISAAFISTSKFVDEVFSFLNIPGACPATSKTVGSVAITESLPRCQRRCELQPDCLALQHNSTGCYLFTETSQTGGAQTCAGSYMVRFEPDTFTQLDGHCLGNIINGGDSVSSFLDCAAVCDATGTCNGFTFDQNTCALAASTEVCADSSPVFIPHSAVLFTEDDGSCGEETENHPLHTLDECKALCNAQQPRCRGFTHDSRTLECSLLAAERNGVCPRLEGDACPACGDRRLYLSLNRGAFDFVPGKVCHGGELTGLLPGSSNTLFECQEACAGNEDCFTVSERNGRCKFGGADFQFGSTCPNSGETTFLKLKLDRFGVILSFPVEDDTLFSKQLAGKTVAECKALCDVRGDCVNALTTCDGPDGSSGVCMLTTKRSVFDTPGELACAEAESSTTTAFDVHVQKTRFSFDPTNGKPSVCKPGRHTASHSIELTSTYETASSEDCAQACAAQGNACNAFEFTADAGAASPLFGSSVSGNCVLFSFTSQPLPPPTVVGPINRPPFGGVVAAEDRPSTAADYAHDPGCNDDHFFNDDKLFRGVSSTNPTLMFTGVSTQRRCHKQCAAALVNRPASDDFTFEHREVTKECRCFNVVSHRRLDADKMTTEADNSTLLLEVGVNGLNDEGSEDTRRLLGETCKRSSCNNRDSKRKCSSGFTKIQGFEQGCGSFGRKTDLCCKFDKFYVSRLTEASGSSTTYFFRDKPDLDVALEPGAELELRKFIRTPDGRAGRELIRASMNLDRASEATLANMDEVAAVSGALVETVTSTQDFLVSLEEGADDGGSIAGILSSLLKVAEQAVKPIPVVGTGFSTAIKLSNSILVKPGAKLLRKLEKATEKAIAKVDRVVEFVTKYDDKLNQALTALEPVAPVFSDVAFVLASAHKCAFEADLPIIVESLEISMSVAEDGGNAMAEGLDAVNVFLDPFGNIRERIAFIQSKLDRSTKVLGNILDILDGLSFLSTILELRIRIPIPRFFGGPISFTLQQVFDIANKIFGILGRFVEPIFDSIIEAIMPDISLPIPELDIELFNDLTVFDDVFENAISGVQDKMDELFLGVVTGVIVGLKDKLPEVVPPCDLGESFSELLGNEFVEGAAIELRGVFMEKVQEKIFEKADELGIVPGQPFGDTPRPTTTPTHLPFSGTSFPTPAPTSRPTPLVL